MDCARRSFARSGLLSTCTIPCLEIKEYERICQQHGLEKKSDQQLLLRFLHDLGSVLNFSDPDSPYPLEETKILNPEWVTRGVYKILNNNDLMRAGGVLKLAQLGRVLKPDEGYARGRRLFIVGMMRKNADEYRALAAVSEAEEAAEKGDGPTALKRLKAAGQWTLDVASRVGIPVAQKAIQSAIGL